MAAGIVALGSTLVVDQLFHHAPVTKDGYEVASAEGGEGGGAAADAAIDWSKVDPAKGEAVFAQCKTCHTIEAGGANGTGPNLHATMGKPLAHVAGYGYTDALKAKGGTWTFEAMDAWLKRPAKYVEGTKMTFAGLSNAQKRGDLIAYINTQGSNLPLPAGPAPAAEAPAEGAEAAAANAAAPADNAAAPAK